MNILFGARNLKIELKLFKKVLKWLLPARVVKSVRQRRLARERARNASENVRDVFSDIYRKNTWGGSAGDFFSGSGLVAKLRTRIARSLPLLLLNIKSDQLSIWGVAILRLGAESHPMFRVTSALMSSRP